MTLVCTISIGKVFNRVLNFISVLSVLMYNSVLMCNNVLMYNNVLMCNNVLKHNSVLMYGSVITNPGQNHRSTGIPVLVPEQQFCSGSGSGEHF